MVSYLSAAATGVFASIGANLCSQALPLNSETNTSDRTAPPEKTFKIETYCAMLAGQIPYIVLDSLECIPLGLISCMQATAGGVNILFTTMSSMHIDRRRGYYLLAKRGFQAVSIASAGGISVNMAIKTFFPKLSLIANLSGCIFSHHLIRYLSKPS